MAYDAAGNRGRTAHIEGDQSGGGLEGSQHSSKRGRVLGAFTAPLLPNAWSFTCTRCVGRCTNLFEARGREGAATFPVDAEVGGRVLWALKRSMGAQGNTNTSPVATT